MFTKEDEISAPRPRALIVAPIELGARWKNSAHELTFHDKWV